MRVAREEISGPGLTVLPYDDPDELAALANDTDYGLAAAIWSRDTGTANRLARQVKAGTVWINMMRGLDAGATWGGMKSSGVGREMGWAAIESHTEVKSVRTSPNRDRARPPSVCRPRHPAGSRPPSGGVTAEARRMGDRSGTADSGDPTAPERRSP